MSFVYFVAGGGATKIGVTRDVKRRLGALQVGSPVPLRLIITTPGGIAVERRVWNQLHTDGRKLRHGEWFEGELTPGQAAEVVERALAQPEHEHVTARMALERAEGMKPRCECHGQPMRWSREQRRRAGGYWRCAFQGVSLAPPRA